MSLAASDSASALAAIAAQACCYRFKARFVHRFRAQVSELAGVTVSLHSLTIDSWFRAERFNNHRCRVNMSGLRFIICGGLSASRMLLLLTTVATNRMKRRFSALG